MIADQDDMELWQSGLELSGMEAALMLRPLCVAVIGGSHMAKPNMVKRLREIQPDVSLVVLVDGLSQRQGYQLLAAGATTCLGLDISLADFSTAIRLAGEKKTILIPTANAGVGDLMSARFTPRQDEVLDLMRRGLSNPEIASELHISVETVRSHVQRIYAKLGVRARRDVVLHG